MKGGGVTRHCLLASCLEVCQVERVYPPEVVQVERAYVPEVSHVLQVERAYAPVVSHVLQVKRTYALGLVWVLWNVLTQTN